VGDHPEDDFGRLPQHPGLWAKAHPGEHGLSDRELAQLARQDRTSMRAQALDDQMFAACLAAFGGDTRTAHIFWSAGRTVAALSRPRAWWGIKDPPAMIRVLLEDHPEWSEQDDERKGEA
jgi:hypothetical protein